MSVLGFDEAFANAWQVTLSQEPLLTVRVASPIGILLLKLIAWTERGIEIRGKDAADIYYVIRHYPKIPQVVDVLYDNGYMEAQEFDETSASVMMLADEMLAICSSSTIDHIRKTLLTDEANLERLTTDINRHTHADYDEAHTLIRTLQQQLLAK